MTVQFIPVVARRTSPAAPGVPASPPEDSPWVDVTRRAAQIVFPALIAFSVLVPHRAGRVFWTIAIACLPLFFVIAGYHRWRRICPLAFVAQIPVRIGKSGRRRAGKWLQAHAYHVSFGVLFVSLWLRLIATNGDGYVLAIFVGAVSLAALATAAKIWGTPSVFAMPTIHFGREPAGSVSTQYRVSVDRSEPLTGRRSQ